MKKITKMNEAAWLLGLILCALGVAMCTKAGFGISMIAAPPYILHLKLVQISPFFTQGACEYLWQGFLTVVMCAALRRFRISYILSFGTGMIFGFAVDAWLMILGSNAVLADMGARIAFFALGEIITALAIAFFFRTSMPLEIYELLVTEFADKFGKRTDRVKMINDVTMLAVSVALALILNGSFAGLGIGTIIITVVNAPLIKLFGKLLDRFFEFSPRFPRLIKALGGKIEH